MEKQKDIDELINVQIEIAYNDFKEIEANRKKQGK